MKVTHKFFAVASLFLTLFSNNSLAIVADDPFEGVSCLTSNNSDICVKEMVGSDSYGEYQITNNSNARVLAFAVTNPTSLVAFAADFNWYGTTINLDAWNQGTDIQFFDGSETPTVWHTKDMGSYQSLFGSEETQVNFYWNQYAAFDESPLVNNTSKRGFNWGPDILHSNMVAFGENGAVLASSIAAVPEPETYAMFLMGLGLMGVVARRKQQM